MANLKKWRMHYHYSTFISGKLNDLEDVAKNLITQKFASLIYHSNGKLYTNIADNLIVQDLEPVHQPNTTFTHYLPPEGISGYSKLYLKDALESKAIEEYLFSDIYLNRIQYIKCYLNKFVLETEKERYHIYPIVKIYNTGNLTICFRYYSSENCKSNIDSFVNNNLNLYKLIFKRIYIPKQLSKYAFFESGLTEDEIKLYIDDNILDFSDDTQNFTTIDITELYPDYYLNLDFVRNFIFAYLEVLLGSKSSLVKIGEFWKGRPLAYIEDWDLNNDEDERNAIFKILSRTEGPTHPSLIENDLRLFDDYKHFANEAVTLIIDNSESIASREQCVFTMTILEEEILHLCLLYHKLLLQISNTNSIQDVYKIKEEVVGIQNALFNASISGEIQNAIEHTLLKKMRVGLLKEQINELIDMKSFSLSNEQNSMLQRISVILTFVFGLLNVSWLFEYFVVPILGIKNSPKVEHISPFILTMCVWMIIIAFFIHVKKPIKSINKKM